MSHIRAKICGFTVQVTFLVCGAEVFKRQAFCHMCDLIRLVHLMLWKNTRKGCKWDFAFFAFFWGGGVDLQNVKPQWLPLLLLSDVWQTTPAPLLVWVWQHFSDRNTCKDLHINSKHVPSNLHVCKPALAHSHHPSPVMKSLTTTQLSENHWHTLRSRLKILHIKHRKDCPCTFYATA